MKTPSWRGVLPVIGLIGMLAVVAVAAAGHSPAGGASRPSTSTPHLVKDYIGTLALIMIPIGAFLIFWSAFLRRAYANVPLKKSPLYPGQIAPKPLLTVAFIFLILFMVVRWWHPTQNSPFGGAAAGGKSHTQKTQPGQKPYEPHFQWFPVFVIGSLVVGLGGAMAFLALRPRHEEVERAPVRETLAEVLSETLDDLRRERDPRKAVIGAYVKMERTLAARGFPRHEYEAPLQYLGRILGIIEGSGHSARRLTRLFERARFSPHEIDQKMKDDAIESLVGLRAQLEAPAT
jgi:ABC-type cobalt transport system substrate-binding protein